MREKIVLFARRCRAAAWARLRKGWIPQAAAGLGACLLAVGALLCAYGTSFPLAGVTLAYAASGESVFPSSAVPTASAAFPEIAAASGFSSAAPAYFAASLARGARSGQAEPSDEAVASGGVVSSGPASAAGSAAASDLLSASSAAGASSSRASASRVSSQSSRSASSAAASSRRARSSSSPSASSSRAGSAAPSAQEQEEESSSSAGITGTDALAQAADLALRSLTGQKYICFTFKNILQTGSGSKTTEGQTQYCPGAGRFFTEFSRFPAGFPSACYSGGTALFLQYASGYVTKKSSCSDADFAKYAGLLPRELSASQVQEGGSCLSAGGTGTVSAVLGEGEQQKDVCAILSDSSAKVMSESLQFTLSAGALTGVTQSFAVEGDGGTETLTLQKSFYTPEEGFDVEIPGFAK